jgi:hypothetical protein
MIAGPITQILYTSQRLLCSRPFAFNAYRAGVWMEMAPGNLNGSIGIFACMILTGSITDAYNSGQGAAWDGNLDTAQCRSSAP